MRSHPGTHLEVRAGNAACYLSEERLLHLDKLPWLYHVKHFLKLIQEHHLRSGQNTATQGSCGAQLSAQRGVQLLNGVAQWVHILSHDV